MGRSILAVAVLAVLSSTGVVDGRAVPTERIGVAGVSIAVPPGWHTIPQSPRAAGNDPATRIVAASAPVRFGRGCNELDLVFPRTAVAIVLVEWVRPTPWARFAPRPRRFTAGTLTVRRPPALECFDGPGGATQFADRGRRFAAFLLLGRRAPPALAVRARAVLDTLRVESHP